MANIASTFYAIEGHKASLDIIENALKKMEKKIYPKETTYTIIGNTGKRIPTVESSWEGNLVLFLNGSTKDRELSGWVSFYDRTGDTTLIIVANENWKETDLRECLETRFSYDKDFKVYFRTSEPGCGYFRTNDSEHKHFNATYFVDYHVGDEYNSIDVEDDKDLDKLLERLMDTKKSDKRHKSKSMREVAERWTETNLDPDEYIYVYDYDYVA